jgi:hypothetical protein
MTIVWGSNLPRFTFEYPLDGFATLAIPATCWAVNCRHWITVTLLATLLMGCASQSSPCGTIDPQDPESEGAREYCRDLAPLRALEIAAEDEAYELLKGVGLAPGATPGVSRALDTHARPAP